MVRRVPALTYIYLCAAESKLRDCHRESINISPRGSHTFTTREKVKELILSCVLSFAACSVEMTQLRHLGRGISERGHTQQLLFFLQCLLVSPANKVFILIRPKKTRNSSHSPSAIKVLEVHQPPRHICQFRKQRAFFLCSFLSFRADPRILAS